MYDGQCQPLVPSSSFTQATPVEESLRDVVLLEDRGETYLGYCANCTDQYILRLSTEIIISLQRHSLANTPTYKN